MKRSMLWVMLPVLLAVCVGAWFAFAHTEAEGAVAPALVEPPTVPHSVVFTTKGTYQNVADLESLLIRTEVHEIQPSTPGDYWVSKEPGPNDAHSVVVTCFTDCSQIEGWYQNILESPEQIDILKESMTIHIADDQGSTLLSWNYQGCWPSEMQGVIGVDERFYLQFTLTCDKAALQ